MVLENGPGLAVFSPANPAVVIDFGVIRLKGTNQWLRGGGGRLKAKVRANDLSFGGSTLWSPQVGGTMSKDYERRSNKKIGIVLIMTIG
ncbi:hypothetical protein AGR4A_pAt30013 [Agrobacterium tumefaciens str. B6]|uniref:Uncharacterized protein n=2 Tax=Agrobacterium tumefaciens complex TaxID=1183400 RepID=A0A822VBJ4_AGRTU|nr:hypothetical protein AGR4A_pAt30013 [Agrobacterium tumefaciens str. B6]